jgi:hypothetical protein
MERTIIYSGSPAYLVDSDYWTRLLFQRFSGECHLSKTTLFELPLLARTAQKGLALMRECFGKLQQYSK